MGQYIDGCSSFRENIDAQHLVLAIDTIEN